MSRFEEHYTDTQYIETQDQLRDAIIDIATRAEIIPRAADYIADSYVEYYRLPHLPAELSFDFTAYPDGLFVDLIITAGGYDAECQVDLDPFVR